MRRVVLALLLSACATTASNLTPPERVAGCWVTRNGSTLHWRAGDTPGQLIADINAAVGDGGERQLRYALEPSGAGWRVCDLAEDAPTCWEVAQGESGSLEGGRAFIDRSRDGLSFTIVGGDGRSILRFVGTREECS